MKQLLLPFVLGSFFSQLHAQQYRAAIGFKSDISTLNLPSAELSFKGFFAGPNAIEVNLGGSQRYFWTQAMYIRNQEMKRDLNWYWGAGVDLGYWVKGNSGSAEIARTSGFWTGLDGTIGLEYTFQVVPINLALDTGPSLRVVPDVKFGWMAGFAMRYAFR